MNVFSSDSFLETAAEVYFPNQLAEIVDVQLNGHFYRTLLIDKTTLIGAVPFMECFEPMSQDKLGKYPQLSATYLPDVYFETVSLNEWNQKKNHPALKPAPFLDMASFNSFDELKENGRQFKGQTFGQSTRRSINKLRKNFESIEFQAHCPAEQAKMCITLLSQWKKAEFKQHNLIDVYMHKENRLFLARLIEKNFLKIATLLTNNQPIAVIAYYEWEGRLTYSICSYNPNGAAYRPGIICLEKLIEHSFEKGIREFDFSIGDDPYKLGYCNKLRVYKAGGVPHSVWQASRLRRMAIAGLRKTPLLYVPLKKMMNKRKESAGVQFKYGEFITS